MQVKHKVNKRNDKGMAIINKIEDRVQYKTHFSQPQH